jgi:formiminoglutamate deiminase
MTELWMSAIHARSALTPSGWRSNVRLVVDGGRITSLETGVQAQAGDERAAVLVPGMPNLHSHAFQRGMAGLAEMRGPSADTFWTWREVMYRFALTMTSEQMEAIAAQLYVEMLEAGFTRVGEFHYLHHDKDGQPYGDLSEMARRIASAADGTGIGLTLLPVFYAHSNFGRAAPGEGQRRFINDLDGFAALLDASRKAIRALEGAVLGVAPHSLRAVAPEQLAAVVAMAGGGPIHIHVAEQVKEVEDCLAWSGKRPVEWLLDNAPVDARWCLIHATHMTSEETRRMAERGAVAGLCPITEANLGDGIFNAPEFVSHGGKFGIGSDSNILIGVSDELRQLEYAQRLKHRARNVLAANGGSTGRALFDAAVAGGNTALGVPAAGLAGGAPADFVSLDITALPDAREEDGILDAWIFASGVRVDSVWVRGEKLVEAGRHHRRNEVAARFREAMRELATA